MAVGFCNSVEHVGLAGCLEFDNLHRHPQLLFTISFGFLTTSVLDPQAHFFLSIFWGFFMQIDDAEWPLPLQCFPCVFD